MGRNTRTPLVIGGQGRTDESTEASGVLAAIGCLGVIACIALALIFGVA